MIDIASYQAPTNALPSSGLASSVSVLTTMRSMISPGIWELSNTSLADGFSRMVESNGFQVTVAWTSRVSNAATRSASETLTTFTSRSDMPT